MMHDDDDDDDVFRQLPILVLRNKERFLATRCCGSVGGSSWLYFTRQDCTYRHIYLYIGLVVVSLSLFFSALSLPACSSTGEESCVYKKLRAYDPHEGQGPLHGWFTRFDVATSFTIISRQSCLQERDISQIRIRKGKNDQGQQEQRQHDEDGAAAAAAKMVGEEMFSVPVFLTYTHLRRKAKENNMRVAIPWLLLSLF